MASDPNIKQGGEKPESTVHIEAVTFDVIQARIKKQVRKTVAVSIIGVLVPLLVTSITGLAQLFSKQDEFRISVEKKYTEFTQQQSKDILEFKAALDKR